MKKDNQEMMLAVVVSLICNAVLFIIKGITLVIVNSLAVAADLGISVVALGISVFLYYAIKMSNKPADIFHNYGYGKIENVAEAVEGVILIGLALAMFFQAILHLIRVGEVSSPVIGFAGSLLGVAINFWGAQFILKLADKHASPALHAEGIHFRLEGFISLAITFSFALVMVFNNFGLSAPAKYMDPIATLIVSVAITVPSVRLLRKAFMKLLDASIEESGQMDIIKVLARHFHTYCNFGDIKTRTAGRKHFVDINVIMPDHISVKKAHLIANTLKHDIASHMSESEVVVHIEPCARDCSFVKKNQKCPYAD
jgi:cation diffusion facilitator family transporter